jgi:carboxypeptidase T
MLFRKIALSGWLLCLAMSFLTAQNYSRIKIDLENHSLFTLQRLGIEFDHGKYEPGRFFESDFSKQDLEKLRKAGVPFETLVEDAESHYENLLMAAAEKWKNAEREGRKFEDCFGLEWEGKDPSLFQLGSMNGYFRYGEMLDQMDLLFVFYPHLISQRAPIADFRTAQGRPIFYQRISKTPNEQSFDKPQILYTALHHAREPMSVVSLFYFAFYLLENYDKDAEIKALIDNSEILLVPVVNPDGVLFNEQDRPNGGGLWRKNRRNNGDGTFGVDLNRNYGANWGFDDIGSSPNPQSAVYRGLSAFSEPESQALKYLCEINNFSVALNYHSFGNLLVFPYGYQDLQTPDSSVFRGLAEMWTRDNNYRYGNAFETVEYFTNGDSDDWMYSATTKPKILAFTPEIGESGFYPTNIMPLARKTLYQNLSALRSIHNHILLSYEAPRVMDTKAWHLPISLKQYGLNAGREAILQIRALAQPNDFLLEAPKTYALDFGEERTDSLFIQLNREPQWGEFFQLVLELDNGLAILRDTLNFIYGKERIQFASDGQNFENQWTRSSSNNQGWQTTDEKFRSAPYSITDSPYDTYDFNTVYELSSAETIDLGEALYAELNFWAQWEIEEEFDYAQLQISVADGPFVPLCGLYTTEGGVFQALGEPVYQGEQYQWVRETIDLSAFLGERIALRFLLVTDGLNNKDGFYLDDLSVRLVPKEESTRTLQQPLQAWNWRIYPNPAQQTTTLDLSELPVEGTFEQWVLFNALGQKVWTQPWRGESKIMLDKNTMGLSNGLYYLQLQGREIQQAAKKIIFFD